LLLGRSALRANASRSPGAQWYKNVLGSPQWICAPMVRASELAFRMLVRRYGVDLCYTPMIPAWDISHGAMQVNKGSLLDPQGVLYNSFENPYKYVNNKIFLISNNEKL